MSTSDALPVHLRHLHIPLPLPTPADGNADDDLTWAYAWPGGLRLCDELNHHADCQQLTVADLGCGRGLLGLTALVAGAAHVTFADHAPVALAFIQAILNSNGLAARARCVQHTWGQPIPGSPFDLIVGGDILYKPALFGEVLRSVATSLAPTGRALLMDPRQQLEDELPNLAHLNRLLWTVTSRAPGRGTLVTVTHQPV